MQKSLVFQKMQARQELFRRYHNIERQQESQEHNHSVIQYSHNNNDLKNGGKNLLISLKISLNTK